MARQLGAVIDEVDRRPTEPVGRWLEQVLGILAGVLGWISLLGLVAAHTTERANYRPAAGLFIAGLILIALHARHRHEMNTRHRHDAPGVGR